MGPKVGPEVGPKMRAGEFRRKERPELPEVGPSGF